MADSYREAARGRAPASLDLLHEADDTRRDILAALELGERLVDNLPQGHGMRRDLFRITAAFEALSESIAISAEAMGPRIEVSRNVRVEVPVGCSAKGRGA